MGVKGKKVIKGFEKTGKFIGRWSLKGGIKLTELVARGGLKAVRGMGRSRMLQKIVVAGGLLAATVTFPVVAVPVVLALLAKNGIKNMFKDEKDPKTGIMDDIKDIINCGSRVTGNVCKFMGPYCKSADVKMKGAAAVAQNWVDTNVR